MSRANKILEKRKILYLAVALKKIAFCGIILKESIRFRAATKRTAYTKDKLL